MNRRIAGSFAILLAVSCAKEAPRSAAVTTSAETTAPAATAEAPQPAAFTTIADNQVQGTWRGQVKIDAHAPHSMFNYVGAESGDFAPIRFENDSEAGRKILAACADDDLCEFTGVVEWLDEPPPPDASAIGRIVSVESAKRVPDGAA